MMAGFANPTLITFPAATGRMQRAVFGLSACGAARLSTDPLFLQTLTLRNIIAGSRYRITRADTGAELATGLVAGSGNVDEVIASVPCFVNPQEVDITVRNASGSTKYKPFDTVAFIGQLDGGEAYILQIED